MIAKTILNTIRKIQYDALGKIDYSSYETYIITSKEQIEFEKECHELEDRLIK